jgi:hypothetical protein
MSSFHFYGTAKYYVGYYQETWRNEKVQKFIIKGVADTKDAADKINKKLSEKLDKYSFHVGHTLCKHAGKKRPIKLHYKILSERQYKAHQASRKQAASEKRQATIAKKPKSERTRTFILCPRCRATSKLICSEMGGLQTRVCKNGHQFEYDKWLGDRVPMAMIFGNPVAALDFVMKNPVKVVGGKK